MRRISTALFKARLPKKRTKAESQETRETMVDAQHALTSNIVLNHDFSEGLNSWHTNSCDGYVVSGDSGYLQGVKPCSQGSYAVILNRTKCWQGLEQDITSKVSPGFTYAVSACVRVWGDIQEPAGVQATLKVEYPNSATSYVFVGRVLASKERWDKVEGTFSLDSMPGHVIFYLEGPSPGVDLLVDSVVISCSGVKECEETTQTSIRCLADGEENIIQNPQFEDGLNNWSGRGCKILRHDSMGDGKVLPLNGKFFASATERTQSWNGIQQEITGRVQRKLAYEVTAVVRIFGNSNPADVRATLWVQTPNLREQYIGIAVLQASDKEWVQLQGKFLLNGVASRVVVYLEGPPPGTDILVNSFVVKHAAKLPPSPPPMIEETRETMVDAHHALASNIVLNHDFSEGLYSWHTNSCDGYVVSGDSGYLQGVKPCSRGSYAVILNRTKCWQGLEQDITSKVSPGCTYAVSACVRVWGEIQEPAGVQATLKVEYPNSATSYVFVGRAAVSKERWDKVEGVFSLDSMPSCVIFYLEGPSPGIDLLVDSVVITCSSLKECEERRETMADTHNALTSNIIINHGFSEGLHSWHTNSCDGYVVSGDSGYLQGVNPCSLGSYAVISNRTKCWQGLEQDITSKVSPGSTYAVSASVRVWGDIQEPAEVQAMLKVEYPNSATSYLFVGRAPVSKERWDKVEGTFSLDSMPSCVIFYLEGPSPGVDLLVDSVVITCSSLKECEETTQTSIRCFADGDEKIIQNPQFEDDLNNWSGRGCKIIRHDSMGDGKVLPLNGKFFASATKRTQSWNGIQQEITGRVQRKLAYEVTAVVRIFGNSQPADVRATLWVQASNLREQYLGISVLQASDKEWVHLQGKFLLNGVASKVVLYLEGPPPGTDILVNSIVVKHAAKLPPSPPPMIENPAFGVNIIENSTFNDGLNPWFALGRCTLNIATGSPHVLPPMASASLGPYEPLSGRYILVTNRTQPWMGPAQTITEKLKLHLTYQVSAWVRVGSGSSGPQNVNVALGVDNQYVNGGQAEVSDNRWHEIGGSFRIEKQPSKVIAYIQGPLAGVDLMVAGLQIFPVDREIRFRHLKKQTDKVRKRDVVLKFSGSDVGCLSGFGTFVKVKQTKNSFPFGSCISRSNIDNEDFVNFFVKNFNWAVFGNELKWNWTEPQQGNFNYKDADEMLDLCKSHGIEARGHCIFWEVEHTIQQWVRSLQPNDLKTAVQNRLVGLLSRYKGKFRHYDVNNEMLHGSFHKDCLGKDIRSYMFKTAHQLDPSATLFVNDYHVEDGADPRSSPEMYIQHILDLQEQGAPVGGIGLQGHIDFPVGPIIASALDKLGILGLPIWFTELDVSAVNEYVRADDLEIMLREAFAHPAVEGIVLWGFWELFMSRDNAYLVDAEGSINEAGKRYLRLKEEWLSHAHGHIDDQREFRFRGFHGTYEVEITTLATKFTRTFVVDEGEPPLVVAIYL